ncbi:MAG TPA: WecB/TagA/CpsF family glycosyltransferase [Candidatus Andersenbacteria bacterium]|nr:MAG: hypothetical protein A2854_05140 [Parcubacteria group bacterium RIFCSPHIGHO2_01_FULL_56_18]HLD26033.1 WecB/TagA/CpsF family glycosyltransferase [Candidatus Andersenbacteria bacterium]
MSEAVPIGQLTCDFMEPREFATRCRQALEGQELHHVVTLNPEMVMLAEQHDSFRTAARAAAVRVPDGAGLVWARWYLRSAFWPLWPSLLAFLWQRVERVTGVDTVVLLGQLCNEEHQLLYLLGGTLYQREKTAARLRTLYPGIRIAASDNDLADIQRQRPAVLLVAFGAPKQTEWIEQQRAQLVGIKIAVGVGGAFAMLSEDLPRAPQWLRRLNLEWLWRLYLEPRRWRRIWRATIAFPLLIKRQKMSYTHTQVID